MNVNLVSGLCVGALLASAGSIPAAEAAEAARGSSYFDLTLGGGMLDSPTGTVDLQAQSALGLQLSWTREGWPVHFVLSGMLSDEGDDPYAWYPRDGDAVSVLDLAIGVRKYWVVGRAEPFVGAGVSLFLADRNLRGVVDEDEDLGTWVEGGLLWPLRGWHLGLAGRFSEASVELLGEPIEAGNSIHLICGLRW